MSIEQAFKIIKILLSLPSQECCGLHTAVYSIVGISRENFESTAQLKQGRKELNSAFGFGEQRDERQTDDYCNISILYTPYIVLVLAVENTKKRRSINKEIITK